MRLLIIAVALISIFGAGHWYYNKPIEVEGRSWVTIKAGSAVPLSEVPVFLFERRALAEHIWRKKSEMTHLPSDFEALALDALNPSPRQSRDVTLKKVKDAAALERQVHPKWWFEDAPGLIASVNTDNDGNFRLNAPKGRYTLVAWAERSIIGDKERYLWLVDLDGSDEELRLTAQNSRGWKDLHELERHF